MTSATWASASNSKERAHAGVIATLINTSNNDTIVRHEAGYAYEVKHHRTRTRKSFSALECLSAICDECESLGPEWRIQTISTPSTILADIKGRMDGGDGARPSPPEPGMLARIGKEHLWAGQHAAPERARGRKRVRDAKRAA